MNILEYAKGVERLVDPMMVGKTHHMQTKLSKLPICIQRKIINSATKKANKMPFVVEPYCFFLFYEMLTLASYPLVLHKRNAEALMASRKYLIYTLISGQLFLAGVVMVYCITGTMSFTAGGFLTYDSAPRWALQLAFAIMILAGSVKAAA